MKQERSTNYQRKVTDLLGRGASVGEVFPQRCEGKQLVKKLEYPSRGKHTALS